MSDTTLVERFEKAVSQLTREDATGARRDLEAVQNAGIASVAQLVDAVVDVTRDLEVRLIACSLLALLNEVGAIPVLARAFEEGDDGLEWEAAKAIQRLQAVQAVPTLLRVLEKGHPSKQSAAAWVLGLLRVPDAVPSVWAAAMNPALEVDVRGHAIEALGVMQAQGAVPDLIALLHDESPEIRYWAAYALGQIGDPASIPALERMAAVDVAILPRDRSLRQEALDALEDIRERKRDAP